MVILHSRWTRLSKIVLQVEKLLEANSRLDHYQLDSNYNSDSRSGLFRADLCDRLDSLALRVDHEIDRLTAEYLLEQLTRKINHDSIKAIA